VNVGSNAAYVIVVTANQINVQLPFNSPTGATTVTVTASGGTSVPFDITIAAVAPTLPALPGSPTLGIFATLKGTYVSNSNLANAGEVLTLYAVGLGPTNPVIAAGPTPNSQVNTATLPTLTVGGVAAVVSFAGLSPSLVGLYQINFTVPTTVQGSVPVVLSIAGQSSNTVTLTLTGISALVNAASFLDTGTATPGEIVTIYANGLGSKDEITTGYQTTTAQGVSVTFNGTAAPLFALVTEQSQINLIVPSELPTTGTVQVQLTTPSGAGLNFPLLMAAAVPGIFLITDPANPTADIALAQFANTIWLVMPTSAATALQLAQNCTVSKANPLSSCGQPAAPGDYLVLYTTGLGEATPNGDPNGAPLATGVPAPADGSVLYETVATPTIKVGGVAAASLFSGVVPGFAGLYQIDFQVPTTGVTEGDSVPITVSMPGSTMGTATLAIHSR
jgi:uncharacterized protein (TIGR03437 family)